MSKALEYGLHFKVLEYRREANSKAANKAAIIEYEQDELGFSMNFELGSILANSGQVFISDLKAEVIDAINIDMFPQYINGENGALCDIRIENANEITLVGGKMSNLIISTSDFIEILDEWKEFLDTIIGDHFLKNR